MTRFSAHIPASDLPLSDFARATHSAMASNDSSPKALPGYSSKGEKATKIDTDKAVALEGDDAERLSITGSSHIDDTHRMLKSRHIQLIGIGGTIGTVLDRKSVV